MSVPVRSSLHLVKRKAGKQKQSSGDQQNFAELRKLYHNLQKEHERVGMAFQNLKVKNEELVRDLAERDAAMEELPNLMSTKDEAIKNMERRLPEVQSLRSHNDLQESALQQQTSRQQSGAQIGHVSSHSLSNIHKRYQKVLQVISDNRCSMPNALLNICIHIMF